jgi:hypothetical protein
VSASSPITMPLWCASCVCMRPQALLQRCLYGGAACVQWFPIDRLPYRSANSPHRTIKYMISNLGLFAKQSPHVSKIMSENYTPRMCHDSIGHRRCEQERFYRLNRHLPWGTAREGRRHVGGPAEGSREEGSPGTGDSKLGTTPLSRIVAHINVPLWARKMHG